MSTPLNDNFNILAGKHIDDKYGKISVGKTIPYATLAEALSDPQLAAAYRYIGQTVNVAGEEYHFKDQNAVINGLLTLKVDLSGLATISSLNTAITVLKRWSSCWRRYPQ